MPSQFSPGFRFSAFDALVLGAGGSAAALIGRSTWPLGVLIAFVVLHFFLFCNVFRVSRDLELGWAGIFLSLAAATLLAGSSNWWGITMGVSVVMTGIVIALEMRRPWYHGVAWTRINPGLRTWWDNRQASRSART